MATIWNALDKNTSVNLNGSRGVVHPGSGGWHNVRTAESRTTGRFYFEIKFISNTSSLNGVILGIVNSTASLNDYPGANSNGLGFWDNNGQWLGGSGGGSNVGTLANGDIVGFDIDYDAKTIRASRNNGAWSSAASFSNVTGPYFLMAAMNSETAELLASWQKSHCTYSAPSGASYYDANFWSPSDMTGVTGLEWFDSSQGVTNDRSTSPNPVPKWVAVRPDGNTATTANSFRDDFRPVVSSVNGRQSVLFGTGSNQLNLDTANLPVGTGDKFWFISSKSLETRTGDFYPWGYGSGQGTGVTWKMRQGAAPFSDIGNNGLNIGSVNISNTGISTIVETYVSANTTTSAWYNGQSGPSQLVSSRNPNTTTRPARLGHWPEYGNGANQHLLRLGWGYGNPTSDDILRLQGWLSWDTGDNGTSLASSHPYKNAAPLLGSSTAPNGYVIIAAKQTFTNTGKQVNLLTGHILPASVQGFSSSGVSASVLHGYKTQYSTGSFNQQFATTKLTRTRVIPLVKGNVLSQYNSASLLVSKQLVSQVIPTTLNGGFVGILVGHMLPVQKSTYALTTPSTSITKTYIVNGQQGSLAVAGKDVSWRKGFTLSGAKGPYTIAVSSVNETKTYIVRSNPGPFIVDGKNANVTKLNVYSLTSNTGNLSLSYNPVVTRKTYVHTDQTGTFTSNGKSANVIKSTVFKEDTGSFVTTGVNANLRKKNVYSVYATTGQLIISGKSILFTRIGVYTFDTQKGSFTLNALPTNFARSYRLPTTTGSSVASFNTANIIKGYRSSVSAQTVVLSTSDVSFTHGFQLHTGYGSFVSNTINANIRQGRLTHTNSGSFSITGQNVNILESKFLYFSPASFNYQVNDATIVVNRLVHKTLIVGGGQSTLTGKPVDFSRNRYLVITTGAYNVTPTHTRTKLKRKINVTVGMFNVNSYAVSFNAKSVITPAIRRYIIEPFTNTIVLESVSRVTIIE